MSTYRSDSDHDNQNKTKRNNEVDLLLLFGPNIPEKQNMLPSSFQAAIGIDVSKSLVIDCQDFYTANTYCGLRDIALKIVAFLKLKKQVIVIDDFSQAVTRKSLVDTIRKKVPSCNVSLVQVLPKHGYPQLLWAHYQHTCGTDTAFKPSYLKLWFDSTLKHIDFTSGHSTEPCEEEGYDVYKVYYPLRVKSAHELNLPVLFVQWKEKEITGRSHILRSEFVDVCSIWCSHNPFGRVIFILNGQEKFEVCEDSPAIKDCLNQLSKQIKRPVYAVRWSHSANTGQSCAPPEPQIIAYLQRRHCLDLLHANSICIYADSDYRKLAENAGLQYVQIAQVLKNYSKNMGMISGNRTRIPEYLLDMEVSKLNKEISNVRTLPLWDMRHLSEDGCVRQFGHNQIMQEMVFFSDIDIFNRHQELYAKAENLPGTSVEASDVKEAANTLAPEQRRKREKIMAKPSWMMKKRRESSECSVTRQSIDRSDSSDSGFNRCSQTLYIMSQKELLGMAQQVMKQAGCRSPKPEEYC